MNHTPSLKLTVLKITLAGLALSSLASCGSAKCGFLSKATDEAACHNLRLSSRKVSVGGGASCLGAAFSRRVNVQCATSTGINAQCTSISDGFPLYVLVLPNNGSGSFIDQDGTVYNNCGDIWPAFFLGNLVDIKGYYSTSTAPDVLSCTDAGGCNLASATPSCISGWGPNGPTGTASLPNGTNVLVCSYIDNSSLPVPTPPQAAFGVWSGIKNIPAMTISGNLQLITGWQDTN